MIKNYRYDELFKVIEIVDSIISDCSTVVLHNELIYSNNGETIYEYDEEITRIFINEKSTNNIISDVLELQYTRQLSKKEFHKFIEIEHKNSDYEDYPLLFDTFKKNVENLKNEYRELLNEDAQMILEKKLNIENSEYIEIKAYNAKWEFSTYLDNSIMKRSDYIKNYQAEKKKTIVY